MGFNFIYFVLLIVPSFHLLFIQILKLDIHNPSKCLKIFKSNNILGLIIYLNLIVGKIA